MKFDQKLHYDNDAPKYNRDIFTPNITASRIRYAKLDSLLSPRANTKPPMSVLEIGSGTGIYTAYLVNDYAKVTATDISGNMLSKNTSGAASLIECDARKMPFESNSFDLAFAFAVLHHINEPVKVFLEVNRVLKPGASFLLLEPNPLNPINVIIAALRKHESGMIKSWPARWSREAEKAGMQLVSYKCGSFAPYKPAILNSFYSFFERTLESIPLLNRFGLFYYYRFVKKGEK